MNAAGAFLTALQAPIFRLPLLVILGVLVFGPLALAIIELARPSGWERGGNLQGNLAGSRRRWKRDG